MAEDDIALEWPIKIRRGRDLREPFGFYETITDGVPTSPVDLTNITLTAELRRSQDIKSEKLADLTIEVKDAAPTLGEIFMTLTDTLSKALPLGDFYYDIMATDADGLKFTWVYGTASVLGSVTDNA